VWVGVVALCAPSRCAEVLISSAVLQWSRRGAASRPQIGAATRIRNACAFSTHKFFTERGFLYIHTPIITTSDCEGAGEMFQVTTIVPSDPKVRVCPVCACVSVCLCVCLCACVSLPLSLTRSLSVSLSLSLSL
jgi:aspartyl/asparaginyl-tRNA synthetase